MSPALAAAIDVAESLAWYPIANGTTRSSWYFPRKDAARELVERLGLVRLSANAGDELRLLVGAMRRAARCTYCNRCGPPYAQRRAAILQLRGCLVVWRRTAAVEAA